MREESWRCFQFRFCHVIVFILIARKRNSRKKYLTSLSASFSSPFSEIEMFTFKLVDNPCLPRYLSLSLSNLQNILKRLAAAVMLAVTDKH